MNQIRINEIETAINRDYGNIAGMIVQKRHQSLRKIL